MAVTNSAILVALGYLTFLYNYENINYYYCHYSNTI